MDDLHQKAQSIKVLALDVDGVLTNGLIYYGTPSIEMRGFNIRDGQGIKLLQKSGITIAIITAKKNEAVARRLQDLNITAVYMGYEDKLPAYENLKQQMKVQDHEVAYMGDDLPDLPILMRTGLSVTVPEAPDIVKQSVDLVTHQKGGKGAVREVCEYIMHAQNTYHSLLQAYLTK